MVLSAQLGAIQRLPTPQQRFTSTQAAWKQGNLDMARTNRFCWWALTEQSCGWAGTSSN